MRTAFVLLKILPQHETEVLKIVQSVPQVEEVHGIFGEYDLLVKVVAQDDDELEEIVIGRIRGHVGVRHTETLLSTPF
ncbi:MAG TPA: Lrp/AsnC ligand binding domain-containing protein [Candidatus Thermoplasmatota archaeon]|nr:Lrp/AsnC ligand binding domain-containing protein [Candidatus Thermoplasmatota archaeon]